MLEVQGIARCTRCNVISTPLSAYDYTDRKTLVLPHDWLTVRTGVEEDETVYHLCPSCTVEAVEWLTDRPVRQPTYPAPERLAEWEKELLYGWTDDPNAPESPLDFVSGLWDSTYRDCPQHSWHWGFASSRKVVEATMKRYCRTCGVVYSSIASA
jgi:hypothetical protein